MLTPYLTKEQLCKRFNCTIDQLNKQYKANYEQILKDVKRPERID